MIYFYLLLSVASAHTSNAVPNPIRSNANAAIPQAGLFGPQYAGVSAPSPSSSVALLSAQLMENPTQTNEIGISYQMGRTALVSMQLLDILGKSIPISNAKSLLEQPGTHEASLPVPNLPSGTYYLRLSTDGGDAITLKLVKQ